MKKQLLMTFALFMLAVATGFSQKVKLDSNLDFLKGVKKVKLEYKYDNMAVGKFKTNDEYVNKKKGEYNKKESGKGDDWAKKWVDDRSARYQPHFEQTLGEFCKTIDFDQNNSSDITMIVETLFTEPGYNIEISRKSASINLLITFQDKSGKKLASMTLDKVPGRDAMGFDYDTGVRIEEAYEKAGKSVGKFISSKVE